MNRVWRLVLVAVLTAPLAGCGIPDDSAVFTRGAGPSPGVVPGVDTAPVRRARADTTDRAAFVENLLEAAAGELDGSLARVQAFLSGAARSTFDPDTDKVTVVRLTEPPLVNPGSNQVLLKVQQVGVLGRGGIMSPPEVNVAQYEFEIGPSEGGSGLYLTRGMPSLMISTAALDRFYQRRSLYFWTADRTRLVPDLRYLPREVPSERQPTDIIDWLSSGPSDWLRDAVQPLPDGTKRAGNVPAVTDGRLKINLTGVAESAQDPGTMQRLAQQIMWSLRPTSATALELSIDNQVRATLQGADYLGVNPAWRSSDNPERFCVVQGQVRRLRNSAFPNDPVPTLDDNTNRDVVAASLARAAGVGSTGYAALVVNEKEKQVLRVGRAEAGRAANLSRVALPQPVGRPLWASTPVGSAAAGLGIVVAGERLWSFTSDGADPRLVDWPGGPARIEAAALAPDGHRLAVLAGGRLYLTALRPVGPGLRTGPGRLVATPMRDLSAVDWSSEGSLLVAGVRADTGRVALLDVPIDGARALPEYRLADLGLSRVQYLAAFPTNPASSTGGADAVAYTADQVSWDALTTPQRIEADDVSGSALPADSRPAAPFFLD